MISLNITRTLNGRKNVQKKLESHMTKSVDLTDISLYKHIFQCPSLQTPRSPIKMASKRSLEKFPSQQLIRSLKKRNLKKINQNRFETKQKFKIPKIMIESLGPTDRLASDTNLLTSFIIRRSALITEHSHKNKSGEVFDNLREVISRRELAVNKEKEGLNRACVEFEESAAQDQLQGKSLDNVLETEKEERNSPEILHGENIKISILNLNNSLNTARKNGSFKSLSYKERLFLEIASKERAADKNLSVSKSLDIDDETSENFDRSIDEQQVNRLQEYLVRDLLNSPLYKDALLASSWSSNSGVPRLDIGSLGGSGCLKEVKPSPGEPCVKSPANSEKMKIPNIQDLQIFNGTNSEQKMLQMVREEAPMGALELSQVDCPESGAVVYAIRTNLDTIVEYIELLIQVVNEKFLDFVLEKTNRLRNHVLVVRRLRETESLGWEARDLQALGYSGGYIDNILREREADVCTLSRPSKEGANLEKENIRNNLKGSLQKSSENSCHLIKEEKKTQKPKPSQTISLKEATPKSPGEVSKPSSVKPADRVTQPYCILNQEIFRTLTARIFASYTDSNIDSNLFDIQKTFHRSIFDAFNESLSEFLFRFQEYNLYSEEIVILKKRELSLEDLQYCLLKAKVLVIEKASELVGFMMNKEDSQMRRCFGPLACLLSHEFYKNEVFASSYLARIDLISQQTIQVNLTRKIWMPFKTRSSP